MKPSKISEAIGNMDPKFIDEAATYSRKSKSPHKNKWMKPLIIASACLTFVTITVALTLSHTGYLFSLSNKTLTLSEHSHGVKVQYIEEFPEQTQNADLQILTENEVFAYPKTVLLKGTINTIHNIKLDFHGEEEYRAIAEIQVLKTYRGDINLNDTIKVLLPCPVNTNIKVTETDTVSAMKVGMNGIFILNAYDDHSAIEINDTRLALKDIAGYGFPDGMQYAFLEGESELIFSKITYTSIADAVTLDEIEAYVIEMLQEHHL